MKYDKFTARYFDTLPSRKRMEYDKDFLQDHFPDFLYHYSSCLYRVVIVRNYDTKGSACSYSVMVLGHPPAVGVWRSVYNSPILEKAVVAFNRTVASYINEEYLFTEDDLLSRGDLYVSEL